MFTVKVDADQALVQIQKLVPEVREALEQVVGVDTSKLLARAQALASGEAVHVRTGKFLASLRGDTLSGDTYVLGRVSSDDPRASLFDFGGVQQARDILPNARQALKFAGTIGAVYAAVVHRPEVTYPKHPVLHEAFYEMEKQLVHDVESGLRSEIIHAR